MELRSKPVVVVAETARQRAGNYGWRGDTTDNFMFLRFEGAGWSDDDPARRRIADTFVRHEAFHFWNGWQMRQDVSGQQAWLSEGSAEFAALGSALEHGVIDAGYFDAAIAGHLNDCRELIGGAPLRGPAGNWGRAPYACGTAVQWIGSLGPGGASGAFDRFLGQWRDVFSGAGQGARVYSVDAYRERVASRTQNAAALSLILQTDGEQRWQSLGPALTAAGATIATGAPDAAVLRSRLLMHLLAQTCSGQFGFYAHDGFVTLDTGTRCAPAPVDPEVDAIGGRSLFDDISGSYDEVSRRCAAGQEVPLSRRGAHPWRLRCSRPLAPPIEYRIGSAAAVKE
jgi:hypothetical protein